MTEEQTNVREDFEGWAIIELMGHVRMTGRLTEVERFGSKIGKLDVINKDGEFVATQFFGGASVYRITMCDEDTAREMARSASNIGPDTAWSLRESIRKEYDARYEDRLKQIEARPDDELGDEHPF